MVSTTNKGQERLEIEKLLKSPLLSNGLLYMLISEYLSNNEGVIKKIRSFLPEFGNDLYGFCKFIKSKYGIWVNAYFKEDGTVKISFNLSEEVDIPACQTESHFQ